MKSALRKPFYQILDNAGVDNIHQIEFNITNGENPYSGYNTKANRYEDFLEAGIIDPTKVTRCALENAASIASTILLTECTVVSKPKEKQEEMGGMPGMF